MVLKDLLNEETISIGIQILCLKSLNVWILDGKDGNWAWDHGVTPVTHHPPHTHIRPISELIMSYRYDWMSAHGRLLAGWNGSSWQKPFDFQYMYISRRGDIVGPPVWKSTTSPCLSKSKLASLRLWQSEHQWHMLSPLHCHMLTLPGYPTTLSCTRNPSDVKHDTWTWCKHHDSWKVCPTNQSSVGGIIVHYMTCLQSPV